MNSNNRSAQRSRTVTYMSWNSLTDNTHVIRRALTRSINRQRPSRSTGWRPRWIRCRPPHQRAKPLVGVSPKRYQQYLWLTGRQDDAGRKLYHACHCGRGRSVCLAARTTCSLKWAMSPGDYAKGGAAYTSFGGWFEARFINRHGTDKGLRLLTCWRRTKNAQRHRQLSLSR
jgi:hypothetical protein